MRTYLLDTNAASDIMSGHSPAARQNLLSEARAGVIAISSITSAELRYGAKKRGSARIARAFQEFCLMAQVLPWDDAVAEAYAELRDKLTRRGTTLEALDMLIAAHALAIGAVLVTRDRAFEQLRDELLVVNWATDLK